jgi:hypothetical protein
MIVADDAVINRVGRVKLEIFFKVSVTERAERRHGGELSSSRKRRNFGGRFRVLCVSTVEISSEPSAEM